jgi:hypothetical protein
MYLDKYGFENSSNGISFSFGWICVLIPGQVSWSKSIKPRPLNTQQSKWIYQPYLHDMSIVSIDLLWSTWLLFLLDLCVWDDPVGQEPPPDPLWISCFKLISLPSGWLLKKKGSSSGKSSLAFLIEQVMSDGYHFLALTHCFSPFLFWLIAFHLLSFFGPLGTSHQCNLASS